MSAQKHVAVLGATGSVGSQVLDVCRQHADRLCVSVLTAHTQVGSLAAMAHEFGTTRIVLTDPNARHDPALADFSPSCSLSFGMDAAIDACLDDEIDIVVISVVGAAGLDACYRLASAGKTIALANKESLVVGGDLIMPLVGSDQLLPVDSEHAAIFQCYLGERQRDTYRIWLTCSGGPFYGRSRSELGDVSVSDALAHPTWKMGSKITIDSATLMNKGLERIEAKHLFGVDLDIIQVLIHPQSKIHSMVEYCDGSVIAHLGASDMRIPAQYALSYPERWTSPAPRIDFRELADLSFGAPDMETFRCLALAEQAGRLGGTMPCVLNAANEIAVDAFLHEQLSFTGIDEVVGACMEVHEVEVVESIEQLHDVDTWTREQARKIIARRAH
ncbi:1-deoxy-D-xylulose-5-phosphate reductoisomerase [Collinsella sp. AGMB00827]|uniref:1-deoxy-D-xylulose 5-phosphate reductoisomerase n=1 Tax=Collinsella ureilytica TaxID=2869515 RepID=A0ABS7MKY3_9ACTN|nr:1-deoxy-D-xylulose-5-phosphate reductoisomerase [Collinsella urealyticum]